MYKLEVLLSDVHIAPRITMFTYKSLLLNVLKMNSCAPPLKTEQKTYTQDL